MWVCVEGWWGRKEERKKLASLKFLLDIIEFQSLKIL